MKLSAIKVNSSKLEAGAWVEDIPDMDDLRLKVRGIGNKDYLRRRAQLIEKVPRAQKLNGIVDAAVMDGINVTLLVETVLLGWEKIEGDDGQPLPFSADEARHLLSNPDMVAFRNAVLWAAGSLAEIGAAAREDDAKNSEPPSSGGSNSAAAATGS